MLDFANEYSNKNQTSFIEFLDHYKEKKDKLNIISPSEINAVEILYSLPVDSFTLVNDDKDNIYLAKVTKFQVKLSDNNKNDDCRP